jgi:hypothetical protein
VYPIFRDYTKAPTLFNQPNPVPQPLVWVRECSSTVCCIVSGALAIGYNQCLENKTTECDFPDTVSRSALNVSRFMRDYFTAEEVFAVVFQNMGGSPKATIERLLAHSNGRDQTHIFEVNLFLNGGVDFVFAIVKNNLKEHGALVIEAFKVFPAFSDDSNQLLFHGEWDQVQPNVDQPHSLHALLKIGVARTINVGEMGGLVFLVQNSYAKKPFVMRGLDLLRSMGIKSVLAIKRGLKFDVGPYNHGTIDPIMITSGSPRIYGTSVQKQQHF